MNTSKLLQVARLINNELYKDKVVEIKVGDLSKAFDELCESSKVSPEFQSLDEMLHQTLAIEILRLEAILFEK